MNKPLVLALVGPTASGKSALALRAAREMNGEIVCMDSMQVYRGMYVGTAKPTPAERRAVPHHMLDVADPKEPYSVAEYAREAATAIEGILSRGRLPVMCGGTGLYLRALSFRMGFGETRGDPQVREKYAALARERGPEALHALLRERDPDTALRLHLNDVRRVARALEVQELTGVPFSAQVLPKDFDGPWDIRPFALHWPRETLYARVEARARQMMDAGLPGEVQALLDHGVPPQAQSMQGLGYKELVPYLNGEISLSDALELIIRRTRNYAKRQLTWFRADPRVTWLDAASGMEKLIEKVKEGLHDTSDA